MIYILLFYWRCCGMFQHAVN